MSAIIVLILRAFFALSLFAFLGGVIIILWKDLHQTIKKNKEYQIPSITLHVMDQEGIENTFNQPEFFIGRDPQADFLITDETLSAIHARVFYKNEQWMIEDYQSTNGTFINDERVSTPFVLVEGDEITCGRVNIRVHFAQAMKAHDL